MCSNRSCDDVSEFLTGVEILTDLNSSKILLDGLAQTRLVSTLASYNLKFLCSERKVLLNFKVVPEHTSINPQNSLLLNMRCFL